MRLAWARGGWPDLAPAAGPISRRASAWSTGSGRSFRWPRGLSDHRPDHVERGLGGMLSAGSATTAPATSSSATTARDHVELELGDRRDHIELELELGDHRRSRRRARLPQRCHRQGDSLRHLRRRGQQWIRQRRHGPRHTGVCGEDPAHRAEALRQRRAATDLKGRDRLRSVTPLIDDLLERWVDDGRLLGPMCFRLGRVLDLYGATVFAAAVEDVLDTGATDFGALNVACERRRRHFARPVPLDVSMPAHIPDHDVIPHSLENYDE